MQNYNSLNKGNKYENHNILKYILQEAGKLRLKATWSVSRGTVRRGLMKVYGSNNVKAWAQEIVVLGMLRKAQHPSLLQCLWTSSSNPYYETMTLITGEIITSDSRYTTLQFAKWPPTCIETCDVIYKLRTVNDFHYKFYKSVCICRIS